MSDPCFGSTDWGALLEQWLAYKPASPVAVACITLWMPRGQLLWHSLIGCPHSHSCLSVLIFSLDVDLHIVMWWIPRPTTPPPSLFMPLPSGHWFIFSSRQIWKHWLGLPDQASLNWVPEKFLESKSGFSGIDQITHLMLFSL